MGGVASAVADVVGGAVEAVGNAVEDVGRVVIDDVVKPVAKAVETTVQQAINDPVGTIARVAAVATGNPELLPLINGADAMAHGASLEQALVNTGTSMVTQGLTADIAPNVFAETGSESLAAAARGAASGALSSGLRGGDPLTGGVAGGLNAGLNTALDQGATEINYQLHQPGGSSFSGTPSDTGTSTDEPFDLDAIKARADSASQPVDYSLSGNADTSGGIGLNPDKSYSELTMDSLRGMPPGLTSMGGAQGLTLPVDGGTISAAGFTDANAMPALGDPSSFINDPNVTGQPITPTPRCAYNVNVPNVNFASMLNQQSSPQQRRRNVGMAFGPEDMGIPWLDTRAQMLAGQNPDAIDQPTPVGGLAGAGMGAGTGIPQGSPGGVRMPSYGVPQIGGMTPELMNVLAGRGFDFGPPPVMAASGGPIQAFACGSSATTTFCQNYGIASQYTPKFYKATCGMLASPGGKRQALTLAQLKQMQPHIASAGNIGGMARGGLPAKYQEAAPEGHNPEFITGVTGYYAGGRGTGQSDDIPAMLHDGDYVMDAEAVSAFGDGSSKAGNEVLMKFMHQVPHSKTVGGKPVPAKIADGEVVFPASFVTALGGGDNKRGARMLDEMRQRLREHKRSAPNSKIPPKAKSPVEYLKGVKG